MTREKALDIVFTGKDLFPVQVDRLHIVDSLYLHRKETLELINKIYDDFDNILSELLNKYSTIAEIVINKEEE